VVELVDTQDLAARTNIVTCQQRRQPVNPFNHYNPELIGIALTNLRLPTPSSTMPNPLQTAQRNKEKTIKHPRFN